MHNKPETLGDIIKYAREESDYTVEQLAEKVGVTERYLYKIENEGKKPSYDVLYRIVRELSISPDLIFYPEKAIKNLEIEYFIRTLYCCDSNTINILKTIAKELMNLLCND